MHVCVCKVYLLRSVTCMYACMYVGVYVTERMAGLDAARRRRRVAWRWHVHVQAYPHAWTVHVHTQLLARRMTPSLVRVRQLRSGSAIVLWTQTAPEETVRRRRRSHAMGRWVELESTAGELQSIVLRCGACRWTANVG